MYLWEQKQWPHLTWDERRLSKLLGTVSQQQGRLLGKMEALGFDLRSEANLRTLTEDVIKSSEIEGEKLARDQVRSSIARRLGMDIGGLVPTDRGVEGVVEMMLDATGKYAEPLTDERLFAWHASLFPTGRSGMTKIKTGSWRDDGTGPMQVVSGPIGRENVHYEAPPAERLVNEMACHAKSRSSVSGSAYLPVASLGPWQNDHSAGCTDFAEINQLFSVFFAELLVNAENTEHNIRKTCGYYEKCIFGNKNNGHT